MYTILSKFDCLHVDKKDSNVSPNVRVCQTGQSTLEGANYTAGGVVDATTK